MDKHFSQKGGLTNDFRHRVERGGMNFFTERGRGQILYVVVGGGNEDIDDKEKEDVRVSGARRALKF